MSKVFEKYEMSAEDLAGVLAPYRPSCRYLQSATVERIVDSSVGAAKPLSFFAEGQFAIPESCYIDDTGHFNSVEFNICFNQLAYVVGYQGSRLAKHGTLGSFDVSKLSSYKKDDFERDQLARFVIVKLSSTFHRMINPRAFYGRVELLRIEAKNRSLYGDLTCSFWDDAGGRAEGEAVLALAGGRAKLESQTAA